MRQRCSAQLLSNCETAGPAPWETGIASKVVRRAEVVSFRPHFLYSTRLQGFFFLVQQGLCPLLGLQSITATQKISCIVSLLGFSPLG